MDSNSKCHLPHEADGTPARYPAIAVQPSTKHPLLMDHILEYIFNLIPDTDLATCAKVCQTWRLEAIRALRHRHNVRLESELELNGLLQELKRHSSSRVCGIALRGYPNNYKSPITILLPYLKHTLSVLDILINVNEEAENTTQSLHQFICSCPNLVKLGLMISVHTAGEADLVPIFPILDSSGELKVFQGIHTLSILSSSPTNVRNVALAFPNVETLLLVDPHVDNPATLMHLRLPKLRILEIKNISDTDLNLVLECFINFKLNLECLSVSSAVLDSLNMTSFKKFIESQASTLKSLELIKKDEDGQQSRISCETPFPIDLVNLISLSIDKPFVRNVNHLIKSFPSLKMLHFNFHPDSNWSGIIPKGRIPIQPNMQYLSIDWIDDTSLEKLLSAFPNLIALRLSNCDDYQARIIFRKLPQLKHLVLEAEGGDELNSRVLTDKGLSGLEEADLRRVAENGVQPAEVRVQPYIGSLTKLRSLNLNFRFRKSIRATEISFLYGILDLNLDTLAVSGLQLSSGIIARILSNGFEELCSEHPIVSRMCTAARTVTPPDYVFHKTNDEEVENKDELSCEIMKLPFELHSISVVDFIRSRKGGAE